MGVLSSPRRRRRLAWGGSAALVAGGIAFSMIHWSNTGTTYVLTATGPVNEPAQVLAPPPPPAPFTRAVQEQVLTTASRFLETAVARENVGDSWALTDPSLKAGYTRQAWATQDIPVTPYPMGSARWEIDYSWQGLVGLKIALFPKKGSEVPAAVFDMHLRARGKGRERRWLVSSWTPTAYTGVPRGPLLGGSNRPPVEYKSPLGAGWLAIPFAILLLVLLVPAVVLTRSWARDRRAARRYQASLR
jgi:hypothetical protein